MISWHFVYVFMYVRVIIVLEYCISLGICCRGLAARAHGSAAAETDLKQSGSQVKPLPEQKPGEQSGWFSKFLDREPIDAGQEQHSSRLSDKDTVYELQCNYSSQFLAVDNVTGWTSFTIINIGTSHNKKLSYHSQTA